MSSKNDLYVRRMEEYAALVPDPWLLYFPVNPLDEDSVHVGTQSIADALGEKFDQIRTVDDWSSYIWALEHVCRTYQQDVAFLMYYLMHVAHRSVRPHLPNGDGAFPAIHATAPYDARFNSLGSLSAVITYFTGQTKPNEYFTRIFSPFSRTESIHHTSFSGFANLVIDDLVAFYHFPAMPAHFKQWLVNYISEVKEIIYAETLMQLEYNDTVTPEQEVVQVSS